MEKLTVFKCNTCGFVDSEHITVMNNQDSTTYMCNICGGNISKVDYSEFMESGVKCKMNISSITTHNYEEQSHLDFIGSKIVAIKHPMPSTDALDCVEVIIEQNGVKYSIFPHLAVDPTIVGHIDLRIVKSFNPKGDSI